MGGHFVQTSMRSEGKWYLQTSNISLTLVGIKIVDHSDEVGACRRCSIYIFILELTRGSSGLSKDNCKTRRETFKFWNLVHIILDVWRYSTGNKSNEATPIYSKLIALQL